MARSRMRPSRSSASGCGCRACFFRRGPKPESSDRTPADSPAALPSRSSGRRSRTPGAVSASSGLLLVGIQPGRAPHLLGAHRLVDHGSLERHEALEILARRRSLARSEGLVHRPLAVEFELRHQHRPASVDGERVLPLERRVDHHALQARPGGDQWNVNLPVALDECRQIGHADVVTDEVGNGHAASASWRSTSVSATARSPHATSFAASARSSRKRFSSRNSNSTWLMRRWYGARRSSNARLLLVFLNRTLLPSAGSAAFSRMPAAASLLASMVMNAPERCRRAATSPIDRPSARLTSITISYCTPEMPAMAANASRQASSLWP